MPNPQKDKKILRCVKVLIISHHPVQTTQEVLRHWLHILHGNLLTSDPGEAGAKGSSLFMLILANTRLRLLLLMLPDCILSISNCSGYSPKCFFQHCGIRLLSYVTDIDMEGRKVCTMNYYLHRKYIFSGKLKESEDCFRSRLAHDSRNLQGEAATQQSWPRHAAVPILFEWAQNTKLLHLHKPAQEIWSTGFILNRNPSLSTAQYFSLCCTFWSYSLQECNYRKRFARIGLCQ